VTFSISKNYKKTYIYKYRLFIAGEYTKMGDTERENKERIDEMRKWYVGRQGGIFTQKTREKMITKEGISESSPARNTFWYRQRENVKTALLDLYLFLKEAGEDNVKQVFTEETLAPMISSLLETNYHGAPELRKAEISRLFILYGFNYLHKKYLNNLTVSHKNTIHTAVDLADYLAELLKPFEKRKYPTYLGMGL
jgi:hypothetical protein